MTIAEIFGNFSEDGMVLCEPILHDGIPIHCFSRVMRLIETGHHVAIPARGVHIFLVNKRDPSQTRLKSGHEVEVGKVAFQANALLTVLIKKEDSRRPDCVKAMEPNGVLFNVSFDRNEVLLNELRGFWIVVRPRLPAERRRLKPVPR